MSVGRVCRAGLPVKAVGSESDLRSGASSALLMGKFCGAGGLGLRFVVDSRVGVSVISSRMN